MANIFIDKGNTVVQLEKGKDKEELKTSNQALKQAKDMKVSILVNEDQLVLQKCLQVL